MVITDIKAWHFVPTTWVVSRASHGDGWIVAEEVDAGAQSHIPALAESLVARGRRKINRFDRIAFHHEVGIATSPSAKADQVDSGDRALMSRLLDGHDKLPEYMKRLEEFHKWQAARSKKRQREGRSNDPAASGESDSSGLSRQETGQQQALTVAALGELDEANRRDWQQERRTRKLMGTKGALHAAREVLQGERQQRQKALPTDNGGGEKTKV